MLQRVFQITGGLNNKIAYNCFNSKPFGALDPSKHIYMNKNFSNMYDEPIPVGTFPVIPIPLKQDSHEHMTQIQNITLQHLREVYPNNTLVVDPTLAHDQLHREWNRLGIANFEAEKEAILYKLSRGVFVKESKYRWPVEQRSRLQYTLNNMQILNFELPFDFFYVYNTMLQDLVRQSYLYQSPAIKGQNGPLYEKLVDDHIPTPGVKSLTYPIPENQTLINRFLRFVHQ